MATLSLVNFPKFSESKEILKIGRSEVAVWGGGRGVLEVGLLNRHNLYLCISISKRIDIDKSVGRI